jgi:cellulose 1,4-beta-cellobiosidase
MFFLFAIVLAILTTAYGQLIGKEQSEVKPNITWQQCTTKGECIRQDGKITIDFDWRWLHKVNGYIVNSG